MTLYMRKLKEQYSLSERLYNIMEDVVVDSKIPKKSMFMVWLGLNVIVMVFL